jgi:hypothetical protein
MPDRELEDARRWLMLTRANEPRLDMRSGEEFSTSGDIDLDHRVGRALLDTVQKDLPWWGYTDAEDNLHAPRTVTGAKNRRIQLLPRHLLTINWADSGPGFSWPEAYYVVDVAQLDARIVTASRDSVDVSGYLDLAIGWCRPQRDLAWGTKKVITGWWRRTGGAEPMAWQEVLGEGLISEERAHRWRLEVWGRRQHPW